jgi:hypothetical protein
MIRDSLCFAFGLIWVAQRFQRVRENSNFNATVESK